MKIRGKWLLPLIVLLMEFISLTAHSQTVGVTIVLKKVEWSGYWGDKHGPRLKFFRDSFDDQHSLIYNGGCVKLSSAASGSVDLDRYVGGFSLDKNTTNISLIVETWEKRKDNSNDCGYHDDTGQFNQPDRFHSVNVLPALDLNSFPQGKPIIYVVTNTEGNGSVVKATLHITYRPATPTIPQGSDTGNNCAHEQYTLSTGIDGSFNNPNEITHEWQFNIPSENVEIDPAPYEVCGEDCDQGGNCWPVCNWVDDPPYIEEHWKTVGFSTGKQLTINPLTDVFAKSLNPDNQQVLNNLVVQFKVQIIGKALSSAWSLPSNTSFSPPAPNSLSSIITTPSCSENATGTITLNNISYLFTEYRYILKKGNFEKLECQPEFGTCLANIQDSGQKSESTLSLSNIPVGTYSLFLLNNGGVQGICPRRIGGLIQITAIPPLIATLQQPSSLACNGITNGSISLTTSGGRSSTVSYQLTNTTTGDIYTSNSTVPNASMSFTGLKAGNHKLVVSDGCTPQIIQFFNLVQPVKVNQNDPQFENVAATCSDPGNGTAKIYAERSAGAFDVSTSATALVYEIFKDNVSFNKVESSNLNYTWNNLAPGANYEIRVKEKDGADCNAAVKTFSIAGPSGIGMTNLAVTPVTCFGGNNGAISVRGTGRTAYIYQITRKDGVTFNNTIGDFSALNAGGYKLVIKNTATCNDSYIKSDSIQVEQPQLLTATISKTDISCYGLTDGKITSTVTGGTEATGYDYIWETFIDGTNPQWIAMSNQGATLSGRSAGDYRLRVKDTQLCETLSNEVTIIEPSPLIMSAAVVSDIVCLGEKGKITPTISGGITPYALYYSTNSGSTFTTFTSGTLLDASNYQVKVQDKNGCEHLYPDDLVITAPPSALSFTEQLSDFNGFNISCYGGSNGSAIITASGGNGANYSGYTYAVDNRTFQSDPNLQTIPAGNHSLNVKDARGCVASKSILFTQTAALLEAQVVEKQDLICYDGATGYITLTGKGGNAPYQYSMEGSTFAEAGKFSQLKIGTYNITVKDKNNCTSTSPYELVSLHPEIIIQTNITDVSCFDGKDGAVATTVTGGATPYQYQWQGVSSTTDDINELRVGTYALTLTDKVSCTMKATATIQQPLQPLKIRLATVPVCYDRPNGLITATVSGGTQPYQYSIDNGVTYQPEITFSKGAGNYVITSRDSKGCTITSPTTIEVRNTMPEPNFLVASARNALDTLAIIDISVPKPDSIHWTFDPQAIIVKNDPWTPELKFKEAGTYQVKMTGFFAGCDYSVTKKMTLSPYDPEAVKETLPGFKPIESLTATPNPSTGEFEVNIKLTKKYKLSLILFDVLGVRHYNKNWTDVEELNEKIVLSDVPAGVYMLRAITESDAQDVRIVINK